MAFTAVFLKAKHGYVGFIEELPGMNSHGRTIEEARQRLRELTSLVFAEKRRTTRELLADKEVVREEFSLALG